MSCGLSAPKWRTVCCTIPQTRQTQLCLWTNFKLYGGLSAVQLRKTTRGNDASGQILNSTADCPALLGGPSAVHSANSTRDDNVSGQNSRLYGGLSALQKQTVRSSTQRNPPETTSSLDKVRTLRRTVRSPIADRPQFNSTKPPETTSSLDNF